MDQPKLLLVDDKKENLFALQALLAPLEVECHLAHSGREALELLLVHEFILALIDVQMPEMDGFELAELMRGRAATRQVPIIFITAGAHSRANIFKGYEKGAVDFLYKPLDPHVVKSKVQAFIELARQRQLLRLQLQETQRALSERDDALRKAEEALRTRDEFMSIASHELKTPLTSLHLQLQLLARNLKKGAFQAAEEHDPQKASEIFQKAARGIELSERQSKKLASLVEELLDLTRVRLGRLQLSRAKVDLVEMSRESVKRAHSMATQAGSSIEIITDEEKILGDWDPLRIDQVITNLITNAIKYGEGGPIVIRLSGEGNIATFSIQDHGMGVPQELQDKIFERFERAVKSIGISGLGLGLYIARQIIEAHGGHISVESKIGEGSLFTFSLPLEAANESTSASL